MGCLLTAASCGFPRPADVIDDTASPVCVANQPRRCDGSNLIRCDDHGAAEVSETCALGCSPGELRCKDVDPSNGLAPLLDMTAGERVLDLGMAATINADDGGVVADGRPVAVRSAMIAQVSGPTILVLIVESLTADDVTITGRNAVAIVCRGDLQIRGVFAASANLNVPGPGAFSDAACKGGDASIRDEGGYSGAGGGGFGLSGGHGGAATTDAGTANGGSGGAATGSATLVPLRGGCDSGNYAGAQAFGAGGGAIQLVSRTRISIGGVLAANGSAFTAGGSGGGILLEAPLVEVTGGVVANGGAGAGGCLFVTPAESGRLDSKPAAGNAGCSNLGGKGGDGGAGTRNAAIGESITLPGNTAFGGHGGGSVGRIRVNTVTGGLHVTGLFSPNPTTGTIGIR